jgi:hypothetical protein
MDTNTMFRFPPLRLDVPDVQLWRGPQALVQVKG